MSTDAMRIDSHHHLWDLRVRDQPWTADFPLLRRSFRWEELEPELDDHDIDGTILVQTVTVAEETPELLALAAEHARIRGVVGWVDLTAPDVEQALAALRGAPGGEWLVGIRHQVQGEPDPRWLLRGDVRRGLQAVSDAGLVYDLLVTHAQLPAAVEVVDRVPGLRWVVDHAGKPPLAAGDLHHWRRHLTALAEHDNVACKLSGLVTEASAGWSYDDLAPVAGHVLERFGADRVMFGSDWPVCLLRTSYDEVIGFSDVFLGALAAREQLDVWGGTARRWYELEPHG